MEQWKILQCEAEFRAVEAPPELVDSDHPRLYAPTTFEDFRKLRLSTGLRAGEDLALLHTNNSK